MATQRGIGRRRRRRQDWWRLLSARVAERIEQAKQGEETAQKQHTCEDGRDEAS